MLNRIQFCVLAVSVALLALAAGCARSTTQTKTEDKPNVTKEETQMSAIDKDQAVALATKAFTDQGGDLSRYDVEVDDADSEWEVAFVGKPPRPPGDETYFYVSKAGGAIRTMHGE